LLNELSKNSKYPQFKNVTKLIKNIIDKRDAKSALRFLGTIHNILLTSSNKTEMINTLSKILGFNGMYIDFGFKAVDTKSARESNKAKGKNDFTENT
jgi:hypothetical protein